MVIKNQTILVWKLGTYLGLVILLGYLSFFSFQVYRYLSFSGAAMAEIDSFYVQKIAEDKYAIGARYHYKINGRLYEKDYVFHKPYFFNEFSAEKNLKYWTMDQMPLWYPPKDPERSILQKNFPFKNLAYLIVIAVVNVYFTYLRWYVFKKGYIIEDSCA